METLTNPPAYNTDRRIPGQRLKELLDLQKVTQGELARRTGIKRPAITRTIGGKGGTGLDGWRRIAAALDVSLDYFFEVA